jgi:hypothetical protein
MITDMSLQNLPDSDQRLEAIFQAFGDLLFILNEDGTVLDYRAGDTTYLYLSPSQFLLHKVSLALLYATLLCLPFATVILIFFMSHAGYLALIYILGILYLATAVLGKYAFFPAPMNVPQGLLMAFSFSFPPMLLFLLPYFYRRSVRQLKPVLQ